jgi:hypothetical protein
MAEDSASRTAVLLEIPCRSNEKQVVPIAGYAATCRRQTSISLGVNGRFGLKATVEPKLTCPERHSPEIDENCGAFSRTYLGVLAADLFQHALVKASDGFLPLRSKHTPRGRSEAIRQAQ